MKKAIFMAIKQKDAVDPRMRFSCPERLAKSEAYYLVSTSYDQHHANMDALNIGGSTTSIATPGYSHMQMTPRMGNDPRGEGYDPKEVRHSYALSDVTPECVEALKKSGRAELFFANNIDEMALLLTKVNQVENGEQPLRSGYSRKLFYPENNS